MGHGNARNGIAHQLDPLSHVITLSLAIGFDGADRFADATPLYAQGLAQSPEAWYAWTFKVGHELALGHPDAALVALRAVLKSRGADSSRLARVEHGLRDPSLHAATIKALAAGGDVTEALELSRWMLGDEACLALLEELARTKPGALNNTYIISALGPKLRQSARVSAVARRVGWPEASVTQ